ncbi:MAG: hypothetical protein ACR2NJ_02790 [Acidimicrobiales bacterium]
MSASPSPSSHSCVVQAITLRVAGDVVTEAFAHHFGTLEQEVGVRAGDVLTYVHYHDIARAVAEVHAQAERLARLELAATVSATWLHPEPGAYPPGVLLRFGTRPRTGLELVPRRALGAQVVPAHVAVRVGPVRWQVCDQRAAHALAQVWRHCARMLAG